MRNRQSAANTVRGPSISRGNQRGAMLVLIAVSMVGLVGLLALTLDVGYAHRQRRTAQTAADAGAQAGAIEIFRGHRDSAVAAAHSETARNGFTNGSDNVIVTVNNPPASGPHHGDTLFVEVVVQQTLATMFGIVLDRPTLSLQPRSVAGVVHPANGCLYVLDPTADKALEIKSSGELIATECAVIVNSNDPDAAISVSNNGSGLAATSIVVTGGSYLQSGSTAYITPSALEGIPPSPDPLAGVVMPDVSGACDFTDVSFGSGTNTIGPGVYCGGLQVSNSGTVLTMTPGLYILKGGGLTINASGTVNGIGVSFINTNGPGNNANDFAIMNIHSGAIVDLEAMTTGPLQGILFYQDPAAGKVGTNYVNRLHSGSASTVTGVFYFPTQKIELGGSGATLTINGGVVAKTVLMQSDGTVVLGGGVAGGGIGAFARAAIVE
jgi:type II secretory pathway pseudopilin PulG